ncbi:MAG: hypothetical protein A2096_17475 [Spirochaetes bacterium GWF1_41_5]|nr:MAG: hypothetical protein A2096_17475 [Spirochaetes bacterium GWF1_41_5]
MKNQIKLLITALILAGITAVAVQNASTAVNLKFLLWTFTDLPVLMIIMIFFLLGILSSFLTLLISKNPKPGS